MKEKSSGVKAKVGVLNWILFGLLILYTLSMIILFLWGVSTALKTRSEWTRDKLWFPDGAPWEWGWSNFKTVFDNFYIDIIDNLGRKIRIGIWGLLFNTIFYAGASAIVITAAYVVTAYLVAKFPYWFSKVVYTFVLVTMVIPIIGSTPSTLLVLKTLGIFDTWIGNFITKFNFLGMYFLVVHAAFEGVSNEYREAAMIDGANEWTIFFKIMIPLIMPCCYTIFLIKFIEFWNDYQTPVMFMPTHPTLAYGVYRMSVSNFQGLSSEPIRLASCMILALPILALFIAFRNKILGNVSMGGVKE